MSTAGKGVSLTWDLLFQDALQPGEELPQNRLLSLLSYLLFKTSSNMQQQSQGRTESLTRKTAHQTQMPAVCLYLS